MSQQQAYARNDIYRFFSDLKLGQPGILHFQTSKFVSSQLDSKGVCVDVRKGDRPELMALLTSAVSDTDTFLCSKPEQIILVSPSIIEKYRKLFGSRSFSKYRKQLQPMLFGVQELARNEHSQLNKRAGVFISTTGRLIDFLRMNQVDLSALKQLILLSPEDDETDRFGVDMRFIDIELPGSTRKLLFRFEDSPLAIPSTGVRLSRIDWIDNHARYRSYITPKQDLLLEEFLFATQYNNIKVLSHPKDTIRLKKKARRWFGEAPVPVVRFIDTTADIIKKSASDDVELLIIMHLGEEAADLKPLKLLPLQDRLEEVIFLFSPNQEKQLAHIKESYMAIEQANRPSRDEILEGKLRNLITELRTEADPDVLDRCKRIIKKESKFFERSNLLALMVSRYLDGNEATGRAGRADRRQGGRKAERTERRGKREQVRGNDADKSTAPAAKERQDRSERRPKREKDPSRQSLYIGAGKQQRLYPKDIIALLVEQGGLSKEEISNIKILRAYSFVEVPAAKAAAVVEQLANAEVKGRALRINFTKDK